MYSRAILSLALALACAFTLAGAQEAVNPAAPDTQIMDWVFAMPEGWRVANSTLTTNELALVQPDRAAQGLTQLTFGRPGDIDGDFRKWFDVHWENLKKNYKSPGLEAPTESDGAAGYKLVAGMGAIKMDDGKQRIVMLMGVNKGKRAGLLSFITEDLEQLEANAKRLDGLLAGVRFASQRPKDEKAPALRTKVDPRVTPSFLRDDWKGWPAGNFPLEGLWGAETESTELVTHQGRQYRTTYFYRMFFKDGTVLNRMPAEGLLSFDLAWLRSEFADYIGTYTVAGNVVTVTTGAPGKAQLEEELTLKGADLYLGEKPYRRITDDRPALDGAYIKIDYQRHAPELRKRIIFSPKGSFVDEGFNSILGVHWWCGDSYQLWGHPAEPGNGKWRIEKNTLELIYEDGRKHRYAFHLHNDAGNKDSKSLVLNGRYLMHTGDAAPAAEAPKPAEPAEVQAAPAAGQPDTQIMDWVFAMPEGWRVANSRLTLLTTKELALEHTARASDVLTQLTFGRPGDFEGGFRKWYDVHFENLKKDYPTGQFEAPTESDGAGGHKLIAGVGAVKMDNGRQRVLMLIGVNKGKRAGVMCFITEDLEHLEANAQRLDAMLPTISFASQRAATEKAPNIRRRVNPDVTPSYLWPEWRGWPKGDAPLEGLWGRQGLAAQSIGLGYETRLRTTYHYLLFFKDGTVFTRMPPEGLLSFDVDFLRNDLKEYFGTYTVEGDTVTVKTGGGDRSVTTTQYTRKGNDLHTGEAVFKPIADEKPALDGGYIKLEYAMHLKEFRKGIRFAADGRFADEGFCAMLFLRWWQADNYYLLEQTAEPGTGRWRIEKNTLVLTYDDGRRRRYGFHLHHDKDGTTYLVLNSMFMMQHPINAELPPKDAGAAPPKPETPPAQPGDTPAGQAQSEADTQVYDWLFKMPEGWRAANSRLTPDTTNLLALEQTARADRFLTQVTFGRPGNVEDGLAKWFDGQWQALKKDYKFELADEPTEHEGANGYQIRSAGGSLKMAGGANRVVMLFGIGKGKRVGSICFITEDLDEVQGNLVRLTALLESLSFASLRAKDWPAPKLRLHIDPMTTPSFLHGPTQWPKGDFPLEGIWGMKTTMTDTITQWGWTFRTAYVYVLLFKDGTAIRNMPPEGLLNFDPAWWKSQFPDKYGTYKVDGDLVTITTNDGKDTMKLTFKQDGHLWGKADPYVRLAEEKPKLDGKFIALDRQGSVSQFLKTITFRPDGTFDDEGFNALLGIRWLYGDFYWQLDQPAQAGKGTWRVEKQTLELVYEDGRKRRFGFHTHTEANGDMFLVLNSRFMTRKD